MGATIVTCNLTRSTQNVLVGSQAIQTNRPARMELAGTDTDLRPKAIAETIGKACGCIMKDTRRIDLTQEPLRSRRIFRQDALRVRGAVRMDVVNRRIERGYDGDGDRQFTVLGMPVLDDRNIPQHSPDTGIAMQRNAAFSQPHRQLRQKLRCDLAMHQHRLNSIAGRCIIRLCIVDYTQRQRLIRIAIDIDVTDAFSMAQHRNPRMRLHILHQRFAAARDHHIHKLMRAQQFVDPLPPQDKRNRILRQPLLRNRCAQHTN
jgi:hypothetical protein